jgi:small neutral amino acid transporter SnatA (MarC family)
VDLQLQAIVTLLALINPVVCAAIFMRTKQTQSRPALVANATKGASAVLVILVLAAVLGAKILHAFGVSLDAFSVAGGGVLAWIGFSMLRGNPTSANPSNPEADNPQSSLTPLILFAASPGTITGVITLAVAHSRLAIPVTALVAVVVGTTAMWLAIILAIYLGDHGNGGGFVRDTATRFMGLIVIAMGVQFALTGILSFFGNHSVS